MLGIVENLLYNHGCQPKTSATHLRAMSARLTNKDLGQILHVSRLLYQLTDGELDAQVRVQLLSDSSEDPVRFLLSSRRGLCSVCFTTALGSLQLLRIGSPASSTLICDELESSLTKHKEGRA